MPDAALSEVYIQDCFHSYLRSSLAQAKAERLLDVDVLSSAEGDLMITGPALCLFFAALRSTTSPPSVPLPRLDKHLPPIELSPTNCPPAYASFLLVWSRTVPEIQELRPEEQHDLARLICNLDPISSRPGSSSAASSLARTAAELRAVAIEISQRRSFQERYSSDLQAAIDAGGAPPSPGGEGERGRRVRAAFVPPPEYEPSPSPSASPHPSPRSPLAELPLSPTGALPNPYDAPPATTAPLHPRSRTSSAAGKPPTLSTGQMHAPRGAPPPPSPALLSPHSAAFPSNSAPSSRTPSPSPSLLTSASPAIELIRETLYASLGDVLERVPALRTLLRTDRARAYFGAVALAVLDVATTSVTREGSVVGVLGAELTLQQCPPLLKPFMRELAGIGRAAHEMEEEDSARAVRALQAGGEAGEPRLERVRRILEEGVGEGERRREEAEERGEEGRRSVEGRAIAFANRINALALGMTRLGPFRERQDEVFKVLAGIGA